MIKNLLKKNIRDFKMSISEFSSMFILSFLTLLIFSGLFSVSLGMSAQYNKYAGKTNLADFWVSVSSKEGVERLNSIDSIKRFEKRYTFNTNVEGTESNESKKQVQVVISNKNQISQPLLLSGEEMTDQENGIWLDHNFAKANGYKIGRSLSIEIGRENKNYKILGLIESPDYIGYTGNTNNLLANHQKYGYIYTNFKTIPEYDNLVNQVLIEKKQDFTEKHIRNEIEDKLDNTLISVVSRAENTNISKFTDKANSLQKLSIMFCIILLLLVILTTGTTMKRLIDNQKNIIGTLRALGMKKVTIILHFLVYPLVSIFVSGAIGILVGPKILGIFILGKQKKLFNMPYWNIAESRIYWLALLILVTISTCIVILTLLRLLKNKPADILDNQKIGQSNQKSSPLLQKMSTLNWEWRWVIRDKLRAKFKELIGIIGITGSLLLLVASFGIRSSLINTNEQTYEEMFTYENELKLSPVATEDTIKELFSHIRGNTQQIEQFAVELETAKDQFSTSATVLDKGPFVNLSDNEETYVNLDAEKGVYVTSQVAKKLDLKVGSQIRLKSTKMSGEYVQVLDILKISAPQGIYLSKEYFEELGHLFTPSTIYTDQTIKDSVKNNEIVNEVNTRSENKEAANEVLDSFQSIIILLIIFSLILGWFILYNLGMLNFTEKYREYATMRVLGFRLNEIRSIILKDNFLTWLIGTAISLPLSLLFLKKYVELANTNTTEFFMHITSLMLVLAVSIILLNSLLIGIVVSYHVKKIDMSSALKSIE